jgi:hemerythrin superfamily protein
MRQGADDEKASRGRRARGRGYGGVLGLVRAMLSRGLSRAAAMTSRTSDTLDALGLLEAQHNDVEKLFQEIGAASGEHKQDLFHELADMLAVHALIEEKVFYPNVKGPATEGLLLEAAEEHLAMKRTLADLLKINVDDRTFDAKLSVLQEQVLHHAKDEEEDKLFPVVRAELDADMLAALAGEMIALMVDVQQQGRPPRAHVPAETAHAAPI